MVSTSGPILVALKPDAKLFTATTLDVLEVGDVVRMVDRDHISFEGKVIARAAPDIFGGYLLIVRRGDVQQYMHLPKDAPISVEMA